MVFSVQDFQENRHNLPRNLQMWKIWAQTLDQEASFSTWMCLPRNIY